MSKTVVILDNTLPFGNDADGTLPMQLESHELPTDVANAFEKEADSMRNSADENHLPSDSKASEPSEPVP